MAREGDARAGGGVARTAGDGTYVIRGQQFTAPSVQPGLYVVATPIGNLSDITLRALDTLAAADLIACEDTRVTRKLLAHYGIRARLTAYHDYSDDRRIRSVLDAVSGGQAVALVSDAGTPLISDPGYRLVDQVREAGLPVFPVPGPSSPMAALSGAGLPTDKVHFAGFAAGKSAARRRQFGDLARLKATVALMEAPQRLAASLKDARDVFGEETKACICREMTKLHESFDRGTLGELAARHEDDGRKVKGEIVLLIHSGGERTEPDQQAVDALLRAALAGESVRDAADRVAAETGLPRRRLYQRAVELKASEE